MLWRQADDVDGSKANEWGQKHVEVIAADRSAQHRAIFLLDHNPLQPWGSPSFCYHCCSGRALLNSTMTGAMANRIIHKIIYTMITRLAKNKKIRQPKKGQFLDALIQRHQLNTYWWVSQFATLPSFYPLYSKQWSCLGLYRCRRSRGLAARGQVSYQAVAKETECQAQGRPKGPLQAILFGCAGPANTKSGTCTGTGTNGSESEIKDTLASCRLLLHNRLRSLVFLCWEMAKETSVSC